MGKPIEGPPTYYAIQILKKCSDEGAQFMLDQLTRPWNDGGGGLVVSVQNPEPAFPDTVLHVTAADDHIVRIADIMELKKKDKDGHIRSVGRLIQVWTFFILDAFWPD